MKKYDLQGWLGCGTDATSCGDHECHGYQRPPQLELDYGVPRGICHETAVGSGKFVREWSKAHVTMDCTIRVVNTAWLQSRCMLSSPTMPRQASHAVLWMLRLS